MHHPDADRGASGANRIAVDRGRFSTRERSIQPIAFGLCPRCGYIHSKEQRQRPVRMSAFRVREPYGSGWGMQLQKRDQGSGDIPVDTAELAACDAIGEVYP
ncbi:hypothetical protein A7K93_05135 [Candidatus Methylacidiphilum fumarolicum]|uniref:Uncharacterized protein n=1 Tax=Candidatus Methylacidiphilum fumarolicum TaxID=591154 RepID=A0ABM9ID69_9BACT|nr:hypothetical protein [Candidatus Methylacidiphilum fumarolicum]MBW6415359.1 hypothetical protein [Candidatus Methylacidiphilum fumarolicum]TFE68687.1 hypothetical protein A7K73_07500 [Candidatus Methylacidiphilum fumarolicum]TFE72556.1 hypothetical protein A7K72_08260 [Candidatus Methylacidiphilum fumarolicum]TFE73873.1 hypothetical protein A7K93_05135 [Candidatus Methylacidiphilum fumarolicum]TFE77492.1 hypothetical protein A7D33_04365 [Candidatus Methylacidiphilum fumarolicum]